jgi:ribonucleases P/MRP protein subunit RPP40
MKRDEKKRKKRSKPSEIPRLIVVNSLVEDGAKRRWASLRDHHFLQKMQIYFPCSDGSDLDFFSTPPAYTTAVVRPEGFLDQNFLDEYVKRGDLYCLSLGPSVDRHNTCAIVRNKMILSICHETYCQLGLSGVRSAFKGSEFYSVEIDLKSPKFCTGQSEYERARWCLSRMQPCRFLATHLCEGKSDIVRYPEAYCGDQTAAACSTNRRPIADDIRIPTMDEFKQAAGNELYHDAFEWLGFLHCGFLSCIKRQPPADEFPTILRSPVECAFSFGKGVVYEVRKERTAHSTSSNDQCIHSHLHSLRHPPLLPSTPTAPL